MPALSSRASEVSASVALDNMSFTSHISSIGRAQGAGAGLESMAAGSTAAVRRPSIGFPVLSATGSVVDEETVELVRAPASEIVKKFIVTGYPLTISALAQFSINTVIISVIGKYIGVEELGGASLALGLVNATGFAFGAGLCGALETVLSHTYGTYSQRIDMRKAEAATAATAAGKDVAAAVAEVKDTPEDVEVLYMYGVYTQRMAIILFVVAFPLGAILCFADSLLTLVGESATVTYFTGLWCQLAVYGLPGTLAYQLVQRYYSCQHITKPLSVAMVTAALVNPLLQIWFVKMFGFSGSPWAWLILMTAIVFGLIGYMRWTGLYKKTWGGWSSKAYQDMGSLVTLAVPSMGVMLSEWVALEVNSLAAGFADPVDLAAFSISSQIFGIMWGVPSGVIILTCVFVGNAIGAGQPLQARRISIIALGVVLCIAVADVVVLFLLEPFLPGFFSDDPEVAVVCTRLTRLLMPYHIFDTFQSTVMGILRGCELQKIGAYIITVAFCVVGVPFGFFLFFYLDVGIMSLWIGPFCGVLFVGFPSYMYLLFRYIDWEHLTPHHDDAGAQQPTVEGDSEAPPDLSTEEDEAHHAPVADHGTGEKTGGRTARGGRDRSRPGPLVPLPAQDVTVMTMETIVQSPVERKRVQIRDYLESTVPQQRGEIDAANETGVTIVVTPASPPDAAPSASPPDVKQ